MSSTPVAQNGLDRGLAALETLGLNRPASVLFAEYLSALTAEGVLEASESEQVSAAFNRTRYSAVAVDAPEVAEAAGCLDRAASRLAAMSVEERTQICDRVRTRIQPPVVAQTQNRNGSQPIEAPTLPVLSAGQNRNDTAIGDHGDEPLEPADLPHAFVAASPRAGRRGGLPTIPLEFCALAVLAMFFGGYFFRDAAAKVTEPDEVHGPDHRKSRGGFASPGAWIRTVRELGNTEAAAKHYGKARLALEFALAYSKDASLKDDAETLNNLAWSYVNPDEGGTTNPQRAFELINRGLKLDRQPAYLDTAAEANFQLGNFSDAVRLESEALIRANNGPGDARLVSFFEEQLQKFREGQRVHTAAHAPGGPK